MRSNRNRHLRPVDSGQPPSAEPSPLRRTIETDGWCAASLQRLADIAGGIDALETMPLDPHPAEEFDWSLVPTDDVPLVVELLSRIEPFCESDFDDEYLTIMRRLPATRNVGRGRPEVHLLELPARPDRPWPSRSPSLAHTNSDRRDAALDAPLSLQTRGS